MNSNPPAIPARVARATVLGLALAIIAFTLGALPARAADQSVTIANLAFSPATVSVNVGDSVTWTHQDSGIPHTVTADSGAFNSGQLNSGQSFSQTFTSAGTVTYHCDIHPTMTGSVVVAAASGGATTPPASGTQEAQEGTAVPPATGTGLSPERDRSSLPLWVMGAGMAIVLGAAGSVVLSTRRP